MPQIPSKLKVTTPQCCQILIAVVFVLVNALSVDVFAQQSTGEQIEQIQRQLDQLRIETGSSSLSQSPSWPTSDAATGDSSNSSGSRIATGPTTPFLSMEFKPDVAPNETSKYPDSKITGFFQLDSALFGQSAASIATLGDIQDGTAFRRARLAATGNVSERGSYIMEFDMAQGQARFVDVWGQIKETPLGTIRIGRFRQPFGMSELTSVRELPLMERPTTFALAPFRQTGIMFSGAAPNNRATYAFSGFRTISDNFGNVFGDDGGFGTAERVTFLVQDLGDDSGVAHIGFDHCFLDPARNQLQIASQDEIFVGQQPNLGPTGLSVFPIVGVPPFVNSGVFGLDHANSYNLEAAISKRNMLVQSEYRWTNLELPTGDNATVHGGYITARYVVTGETIPYNRAAGVYGRVKPSCPLDFAVGNFGACELVTQISSINLNPLFGLPGVPGETRRLTSATVGVNWYWWDNAKCQFEWVNGSLNDPTLGDSVSNTLAARFQLDF